MIVGSKQRRRGQGPRWIFLPVGLLALTWIGCGQDGGTDEVVEPAAPPPSVVDEVVQPTGPTPTAQAVLKPGANNEGMSGTVTFTEAEGAVSIVARLEGAPVGSRGFYIHEVGDCSASDFTSAEGFFNPGGVDRGGPDDPVRPVGDLGKIEVAANGTALLETSSSQITLGQGENSIMGRAVIVHKSGDDLTSQPTGARIACGVIEAVTAEAGEKAENEGGEEQAAH